jgi:hypothetical protein
LQREVFAMSGVVKGIKKVFKKTVEVVKKVAPYVAIAAAIYFTGGLALSAFPATASFAASLPGFAGAAGAGTGVFSQVASAIGMGGGLQAGAGAAAEAASGVAGVADAVAQTSAVAPSLSAALGGGAAGAAPMASGAGGLLKPVSSVVSKAGSAVSGLSFGEKLIGASMGLQGLAALSAPSAGQQAEAEAAAAKKFRGSFYGMTDTGAGYKAPNAPSAPGLIPPSTPSPQAPQVGNAPISMPTANLPNGPQAPQPYSTPGMNQSQPGLIGEIMKRGTQNG